MPSRRHRPRNNKRGRNKKRLPNTRKKQPYQKGKQNHMHQNNENFLYYDYDQQHSSLFISPKYCTLKDELLQNPYFTMTNDEYLEYFFEAYRLMQTPYIQSIKAYTSESDLKKPG
eukprot:636349_1